VAPKLYKAGEVCEAAGLQPYVLRSWEKEFPGIGVQRSSDSPRLYRQADLDQVLRIKQLVFGEGLTLAGARRRLEESSPRPAGADAAELAEVMETLGADAKARIATVRRGLKSLLDVLSGMPGSPLPALVVTPTAPNSARPPTPRVAAVAKSKASAKRPDAKAARHAVGPKRKRASA
jgi:DNA-binding transcriptional MerR regulator